MSVQELLRNINREDKRVPEAIEKVIPAIEKLVEVTAEKMEAGGRLFYIGAGTYGMPFDRVIGIIAGGDQAIRKAVEYAEDDSHQAWKDLQQHNISDKDVLVGIAASGRTPYVIGGLAEARKHNVVTGCIVCNSNSEIAKHADYPVEVIVGPEFVTGSTRMKAGTAQKLVLNMISTTVMIRLGRVKGNKMVDMQLTNHKLVDRGIRMVMDELGIDQQQAEALLKEHGSVRQAVDNFRKSK
jgi:N-acetylmuramic acid 6-phosphate etherase